MTGSAGTGYQGFAARLLPYPVSLSPPVFQYVLASSFCKAVLQPFQNPFSLWKPRREPPPEHPNTGLSLAKERID